MRARDIIGEESPVRGDPDVDIRGVAYDSRKVGKGFLFAALRGENSDGHDFIPQALKNGAVAILYDSSREDVQEFVTETPGVLWIGAEDARDSLARLSSRFYGDPSEALTVIGITGTNGKTTTSYLLKALLEEWGRNVGVIGTIGYLIGDRVCEAPHTTPESPDFQRLLREMADGGCTHVVAEVSSHGVAQKRAAHTRFQVAVFTNLTRDHLDYHATMDDYFAAKARLFSHLLAPGGAAVINLDDPYGERLARTLNGARAEGTRRGPVVLTYAVRNGEADITASHILSTFKGTSFEVTLKGSGGVLKETLTTKLVGTTNVYNILAAVGVGQSLGMPFGTVREGIARADRVRGRFERVDLGQDFLALVDYAHTEDALERLLVTARELRDNLCSSPEIGPAHPIPGRGEAAGGCSGGRIITVFGCGGNRDRGKRPKMGEVAARLSDFVIVTSDNPRQEEPKAILRDVEAGIGTDNYVIVPDRGLAIEMSVGLARRGDIVLVAGKGHEEYQEIKGERFFFSDRSALENAIAARGSARTGMRPGSLPSAPAPGEGADHAVRGSRRVRT